MIGGDTENSTRTRRTGGGSGEFMVGRGRRGEHSSWGHGGRRARRSAHQKRCRVDGVTTRRGKRVDAAGAGSWAPNGRGIGR